MTTDPDRPRTTDPGRRRTPVPTAEAEGSPEAPAPRAAAERRVVVAGGGAAGTLVALQLLRRAAAPVGLEVVVVDVADALGASAAFGTRDPRHLLNVPASGMSAYPDEPDHFRAWRSEVLDEPCAPYDFVARRDFARYLDHELARAAAETPGSLVRRRGTVVGVRRAGGGVTAALSDGSALNADALVVATGLGTPSVAWAPEPLRAAPRFVADPWAPGALDAVCRDADGLADVLVVGAGLTMVDVVLTCEGARPGRAVHAISRSGALPQLHAPEPTRPQTSTIDAWGDSLETVRDRVAAALRTAEAAGDDWRTVIDGLRPHTAALWGRFSEAERAAFLARDAAAWNRARHRLPRASAAVLDQLAEQGRFSLRSATVADAVPIDERGLRVVLDDGTTLEVGWVVNAAGPATDVAELAIALLDDLLASGLAQAATAGMGFATHDGRLVDRAGRSDAPIWTLGALRRGELWESTAIPEIRVQAAAVADALLAHLS